MEVVTILWSLGAAVAIVLAAVFGLVWLIERRELASLMLCVLGIAVAIFIYCDLGLLRSTTPAEYGEWQRWYHIPGFLVLIGQLLFVHYYLGTGRLWLMWAVILARSLILIVNFLVHPSFNFSEIISLGHMSLLGEDVSTLGVFVRRSEWQWLATASLILWGAYIFEAAAQRWLKEEKDSKRKALAVSLGIGGPMSFTIVYSQLVVFGVVTGPAPNAPWMLGALLTMAYELGRDIILSRRERLELAELRVQLAQAERVSVLAQLASALAHELSQPLAATAANVAAGLVHLRREKPDLEELRSILDDIGGDDRRAAEIIGRMRQLFKRREIEMQVLSVEDVVQDVVALVRSETISKHVALRLIIPPGMPRIVGDRVHLTQVLLNLLINSIHALQSRPPDDRNIVIEARAHDAKGEVEIAVQDSGPGIPVGIVDRLFQPFFTTKAEGTGIGLALSRTIIEAHGGRLWTDDMPKQGGATFRFTVRQAPSPQHSVETGLYPNSARERPAREAPVDAAV